MTLYFICKVATDKDHFHKLVIFFLIVYILKTYLKSFYLILFFWNNLFQISMRRPNSNPQSLNTIWNEIYPCKSSISILCQFRAPSISTLWRVISVETQNCLCEAQALFEFKISLCPCLLLRRDGCDFCKVCFSYPSLMDLAVHILIVIPVFRSSFPKLHVSIFDFEISLQDWWSLS